MVYISESVWQLLPVYRPHFWNWKQQDEFTRLVMELKEFTDGAPVAVRMVPGASLERDLQWCITCGIDAVIWKAVRASHYYLLR
jgi:hypothetical protein